MVQTGEMKVESPKADPIPDPLPYDEKPGEVVELSEAYTAEEEKAVLRKIDYTILPMVNSCWDLGPISGYAFLTRTSLRCVPYSFSSI